MATTLDQILNRRRTAALPSQPDTPSPQATSQAAPQQPAAVPQQTQTPAPQQLQAQAPADNTKGAPSPMPAPRPAQTPQPHPQQAPAAATPAANAQQPASSSPAAPSQGRPEGAKPQLAQGSALGDAPHVDSSPTARNAGALPAAPANAQANAQQPARNADATDTDTANAHVADYMLWLTNPLQNGKEPPLTPQERQLLDNYQRDRNNPAYKPLDDLYFQRVIDYQKAKANGPQTAPAQPPAPNAPAAAQQPAAPTSQERPNAATGQTAQAPAPGSSPAASAQAAKDNGKQHDLDTTPDLTAKPTHSATYRDQSVNPEFAGALQPLADDPATRETGLPTRTQQAQIPTPDGRTITTPPEEASLTYEQMLRRYFPEPKDDPDLQRKRKRDAIIAAIGDGLQALSNIYFTSKGSPDLYDPKAALTERQRQLWEKADLKHDQDKRDWYNRYVQAVMADRAAQAAKARADYQAARDKVKDNQWAADYQQRDDQFTIAEQGKNDRNKNDNLTRAGIAQAKIKSNEDIAARHEAHADARNARSNAARLAKGTGSGGGSRSASAGSATPGTHPGYTYIRTNGGALLGFKSRNWQNNKYVSELYTRLMGSYYDFRKNNRGIGSGMGQVFAATNKKIDGLGAGIIGGANDQQTANLQRNAIRTIFSADYDRQAQQTLGWVARDFDNGYDTPHGR